MIANPFSFVVLSDSSTPTSDPYRNSDRVTKLVQLDFKSSSTTHHPNYKGSTIAESPTGQSVQPSSSRAEEHEQQQVVQKHLPQLLPQRQQSEERQSQQIFPTTNTSYAPTPASRSVPQNFKTLRITENPLSQCVPPQHGDYFSQSKNFYSETQRSFHAVGTLQRAL